MISFCSGEDNYSGQEDGLPTKIFIIKDGWEKQVRIPYLSITGSHTTN
jgi:hypothetical protein